MNYTSDKSYSENVKMRCESHMNLKVVDLSNHYHIITVTARKLGYMSYLIE